MNFEYKLYWNVRTARLAHLNVSERRVLAAYNVVVDVRKFVTRSFLRRFRKFLKASRSAVKAVNSEKDFFSTLFNCMASGKSGHIYASDEFISSFLSKLSFNGRALGGQAGIIANQLAILNAKSFLYSPMLSQVSQKYLDKRVSIPLAEDDVGLRLAPLNVLRSHHDYVFSGITKTNFIFEFPKNLRVKLSDGSSFLVPRSNRLIVSSELKYFPTFSDRLLKFLPELGSKIDIAIFAGYHYLKKSDVNWRKKLAREEKILKLLKAKNKNLVVHWEYVPIDDKDIANSLIKLTSNCIDSLGINEKEIVELLRLTGFLPEAKAIESAESAISLFNGMARAAKKLKLKRLHLHNLGYYLIYLDKKYYDFKRAEKVVDAALFSSTPATSKAMLGHELRSKKELMASIAVSIPARGFEQLELFSNYLSNHVTKLVGGFSRDEFLKSGIAEFKDFFLLCVPVKFVSTPKATVGIGDIVSSTTLVAEV